MQQEKQRLLDARLVPGQRPPKTRGPNGFKFKVALQTLDKLKPLKAFKKAFFRLFLSQPSS